jgi:hypothetical protein
LTTSDVLYQCPRGQHGLGNSGRRRTDYLVARSRP